MFHNSEHQALEQTMFGPDLIKKLEKAGLRVQRFDEYHHRVNGEIDVWTNERGRPLTWHDWITGDWGKKPAEQVVKWILQRVSVPRPDVTKEQFVDRLVAIGWDRKDAEASWSERQLQTEKVSR
jgi:hypothetical protein